jgi:hypothetical protein
MKKILFILSFLPLMAMAEVSDKDSGSGPLWILILIGFLCLIWVFQLFGNIGDIIQSKAEMAKEEARKLKLDNDERELELSNRK